MTTNKKYLGMTITQIGILAGLGGLAFLLFCIVGWLVIAKGLRPVQPAVSMPTALPTVTLIAPPTQTSLPISTPVPYESLIPDGWVQYKTSLYEIWLPAGYKNAKTENLVDGLGNSPIIDLALRGSYTSKSPNKIYVTVSYEPMTGDSFDQFLNGRLQALGAVLSERSRVDLNTVPAVRLVFSGRKGNSVDINELTYLIQDGTTIWYVQYTAEITEFYNLLSTFEASAETFRMAR